MPQGDGAFAHPGGRTCGAFEQLFGTVGGEFDHQKLNQMPRGEGEGEGGC